MTQRFITALTLTMGLAFLPAAQAEYNASPDLVEVATGAGTFSTLLAAAEAADLVGLLKSEGPYTVFAPTDEAFAALPEGTVEALLADPEALANILAYHVVAGRVTSAQVVELSEAETLQGESVTIMLHDGSVMVDSANVIAVDVEASNGVIHVIDAVMIPNGN